MIQFHLDSTGAPDPAPSFAVSVIGIGGAGSNVIDKLAGEGFSGTDVISMNCDERALALSQATRKVQLGKTLTLGLGCGGDPELGAEAAVNSAGEIKELLAGRNMVFLCVGLGGGTGSGAAPIVARMAREAGAFVVVFATLPFGFEGRRRTRQASLALNDLKKYANALITFENDRMGELVVPQKGVQEAFEAADKIIGQSIRAVSSLVTQPGLIHIGMDDLVTALRNTDSRCLFGFGQAKGGTRAIDALIQALQSPLLDRGQMASHARNVLVHVCGGTSLTLFEIETLMRELGKELSEDAQILFGAAIDANLNDHLSVTILTSLSKPGAGPETVTPEAHSETVPAAAPPAAAPAATAAASAPKAEEPEILTLSGTAVAIVEAAASLEKTPETLVAPAVEAAPAGAMVSFEAPAEEAPAAVVAEILPAAVAEPQAIEPGAQAAPAAVAIASGPASEAPQPVIAQPVAPPPALPAAATPDAEPLPPARPAAAIPELFTEPAVPTVPSVETSPRAPVELEAEWQPEEVVEEQEVAVYAEEAVYEAHQQYAADPQAEEAWETEEQVQAGEYHNGHSVSVPAAEYAAPEAAAAAAEEAEEEAEAVYHRTPAAACQGFNPSAEPAPSEAHDQRPDEWDESPLQGIHQQIRHGEEPVRPPAGEEPARVIRIERVPARPPVMPKPAGANGHSEAPSKRFVLTDLIQRDQQRQSEAAPAVPNGRPDPRNAVARTGPGPSPAAQPQRQPQAAPQPAPSRSRQFTPDMDRMSAIRPIVPGRQAPAVAPILHAASAPAPVQPPATHYSPAPSQQYPPYQPTRSQPSPAPVPAPAPVLAPMASAVPQAPVRSSHQGPASQQQTFDERLQPAPSSPHFKSTKPTLEGDEDLDVPTFLRRKR